MPGIEVRTVSEDGAVLPTDGKTVGELEVRGPWVAGSYYGGIGAESLRTGDMGTNAHGAMKITDRLKDLIKSGASGSALPRWRTT